MTETGEGVGRGERPDEALDLVTVGDAEEVADRAGGNGILGDPEHLVQHRLGVPHAACGQVGDQLQRGRLRGAALFRQDPGQLVADLGASQGTEGETLEPRDDGRPDLAALPGVIALERVWNGVSNERRPLLAVSPSWSDERNEFGVPGTVMALTTQAALRSSHGSVSPYEMHPVFIAHGPSFREGVVSSFPTGAVDLLPTVLTVLGFPLPRCLDGRVLWETLRRSAADPPPATLETIEPTRPAATGRAIRLLLHRVGATTYLHGSVPPSGPWPSAPPATTNVPTVRAG
jgi:hypothetical protein